MLKHGVLDELHQGLVNHVVPVEAYPQLFQSRKALLDSLLRTPHVGDFHGAPKARSHRALAIETGSGTSLFLQDRWASEIAPARYLGTAVRVGTRLRLEGAAVCLR